MLRTRKQREDLCKNCPVARVADVVGDSCSLLILRDLLERPRRFSELEKSLAGISSRTLTNKLKRLEKEGLITHRTGYTMTKKGAALQGVVDAMRSYGKRYLT